MKKCVVEAATEFDRSDSSHSVHSCECLLLLSLVLCCCSQGEARVGVAGLLHLFPGRVYHVPAHLKSSGKNSLNTIFTSPAVIFSFTSFLTIYEPDLLNRANECESTIIKEKHR